MSYKHQQAISAALIGFIRDHEIINTMKELVIYGYYKQYKKNLDCALQLLAPAYQHYLLAAKNCMSSTLNNKRIEPVIIHYHDNSHLNSDILTVLWSDYYFLIENKYDTAYKSDKELDKYLNFINHGR